MCNGCDYWQEMIDMSNLELTELRRPIGMLSLTESVRVSFNDMDPSDDSGRLRMEREQQLEQNVKWFTMKFLAHQHSEHVDNVDDVDEQADEAEPE